MGGPQEQNYLIQIIKSFIKLQTMKSLTLQNKPLVIHGVVLNWIAYYRSIYRADVLGFCGQG